MLSCPLFHFRKGKENKITKEKKYSYTESPKLKERKSKVKASKNPASLPLSEAQSGKRVGKSGGSLKFKPTVTEKIIEQIVQEEIVIEEELPEEFEEVVVEIEDPTDESAALEEETLDVTAADANETIEDSETVDVVDTIDEVELHEPIKAEPPIVSQAKSKVVAETEETEEVENVPESPKKVEKRAKKQSESFKKKTTKVKSQKGKRKTEL